VPLRLKNQTYTQNLTSIYYLKIKSAIAMTVAAQAGKVESKK
jgi:hypothetical protein